VQDTTSRAKELNNLTIRQAPVSIIERVISSAHRQGVDPYAALAATWKESGFGTIDHPSYAAKGNKLNKYVNPMQYNAEDNAPPSSTDDREQLRSWSRDIFNSKIDQVLRKNPEYVNAVASADSTDRGSPEYKFEVARIKAMEHDTAQSMSIDGGTGYLKKMIDKSAGSIQEGFEKYRGAGKAAKFHGRHLMELLNSLKGNDEIRGLIDTARMGA
jgi:hypothetical protein